MSNQLDALIAQFQSYVVAPLNAFGLGGFVFDSEGESYAQLSADITDHYTEDNDALQDQIAIRPKKITLKGYVGELVYSPDGESSPFLERAVQKLTGLGAFLPELSAGATQARQAIQSPSSSDLTLSESANIYGLVKDVIGAFGDNAKQARAFCYFKSLMKQKILMGVATPWEFMTNMAIETVVAIQPEGTRYVSDFAVTLKQIRVARTLSTAYTNLTREQQVAADVAAEDSALRPSERYQGAAVQQSQPQVPIGNVPGVSLPSSSLPGWQSQINNVDDIMSNPAARSVFENAVR